MGAVLARNGCGSGVDACSTGEADHSGGGHSEGDGSGGDHDGGGHQEGDE